MFLKLIFLTIISPSFSMYTHENNVEFVRQKLQFYGIKGYDCNLIAELLPGHRQQFCLDLMQGQDEIRDIDEKVRHAGRQVQRWIAIRQEDEKKKSEEKDLEEKNKLEEPGEKEVARKGLRGEKEFAGK